MGVRRVSISTTGGAVAIAGAVGTVAEDISGAAEVINALSF
jgi:hypothetical protein